MNLSHTIPNIDSSKPSSLRQTDKKNRRLTESALATSEPVAGPVAPVVEHSTLMTPVFVQHAHTKRKPSHLRPGTRRSFRPCTCSRSKLEPRGHLPVLRRSRNPCVARSPFPSAPVSPSACRTSRTAAYHQLQIVPRLHSLCTAHIVRITLHNDQHPCHAHTMLCHAQVVQHLRSGVALTAKLLLRPTVKGL